MVVALVLSMVIVEAGGDLIVASLTGLVMVVERSEAQFQDEPAVSSIEEVKQNYVG